MLYIPSISSFLSPIELIGSSGLWIWLDEEISSRKGCSRTSCAPLLFPRRYALSGLSNPLINETISSEYSI